MNNSERPAALFLSQANRLHPTWDEFQRAVNGRFPIALYDPTKPFDEQVRGVQVVIDDGGAQGTRPLVDASAAAGVKLWHVTTNGLDHVDVAYIMGKGLQLAHAAGPQSAVALAEHALSVIFYFAKNLHLNRAQRWKERVANVELEGQVLGLLGLGASGRELARRAACLGMRVRAVDVMDLSQSQLTELNVEHFGPPEQLGEMAAASDYLSVHVPLTSKTRHIINRQVLAGMKPSAVVINVARGEIIDVPALAQALELGKLKGAGIDVFDHEPLEATNPLFNLANVLLTPHVAGVTGGTFRKRAAAAAENVARTLQGLTPRDQVRGAE